MNNALKLPSMTHWQDFETNPSVREILCLAIKLVEEHVCSPVRWHDPMGLVRDHWCAVSYDVTGTLRDIGHEPEMDEARARYEYSVRNLFGRCWTTTKDEVVKGLQVAIADLDAGE